MRTLAMLALLALLLGSCTSKKDATLDFSPPLKEVFVEAEKMSIDPTKDQVVHFENGTSIDVPKDAFVDQNGNVVTEPVTLALSTYNSPAEILASGIPMAYHDGEQQQDFESAGMFQIEGYAAGQEIGIQEGKELDVRYPSAVAGEYDFFYLEEHEEDGNKKAAWKKLSAPDKSETTNETTPKGLGDFQLKFDTASYPELAELESIQWRVASEHGSPLKKENAWVLDKKWTSIDVSQPKYGLEQDQIASFLHPYVYRYIYRYAGDKGDKTVLINRNTATILDSSGRVVKTIGVDGYVNWSLSSDRKLMIAQNLEHCNLYNMNGEHLCQTELGIGFSQSSRTENILFKDIKDRSILHRYSSDGEKLPDVKLRRTSLFQQRDLVNSYSVSASGNLAVNTHEGIKVYDGQGKLKAHKKGGYKGVRSFGQDLVLIAEENGRLSIWNYLSGNTTTSNISILDNVKVQSDYLVPSPKSRVYPQHKLIVVNFAAPKNSLVWNYEKNEITELNFKVTAEDSINAPSQFIPVYGYNYMNNTCFVYDLVENRNIIQFQEDFSKPRQPRSISANLQLSEKANALTLKTTYSHRLYNFNGTLVKDFYDYDSSIVASCFVSANKVVTVSENGQLCKWNNSGELEEKWVLSDFDCNSCAFWDTKIASMNPGDNSWHLYDLSGSLLEHTYCYSIVVGQLMAKVREDSEATVHKAFELSKDMFQVMLYDGNERHIMYCFIRAEDQEKLERYKTARAQRLATEKQRREKEAAVVRSFAIRNFGIYNWDRYYKDESRLRIAADFDFGIPTDFNDITVFLVTKANGNSVIKYYEGSWDQFSIDPKAENQLLAILPDNKVAYMSNKELKRLDWNAIGERGQHTFAMSISEQPIKSLLQLDEIVN